jgi:hypothetical protein
LKRLWQAVPADEICLPSDPELQRKKTLGTFAAHGLCRR